MSARRRGRKPKLSLAPLAVTFDGKLVLGLGWQSASDDLEAVVAEARETGRVVFVGVMLTEGEARLVLDDLSNGVADATARLGPKVLGRGRRSGAG